MNPKNGIRKLEVQTFAKLYDLHLLRSIQASMVMDYTSSIFASSRAAELAGKLHLKFFNNPANTLTYGALNASVDGAILNVFAAQETFRWTLKNGLRLKVHRDSIGHPFMAKHNKKEHNAHFQSRAFKVQRRRRVLVLLSYIGQINDRLRSLDLPIIIPKAILLDEMCRLADTILSASLIPIALASLVDATNAKEFLSKMGLESVAKEYVDFLEKRLAEKVV